MTMKILDGIRKVLATRILMLLALVGGFVLAFRAMDAQNWASLYVLIAYCTLTVLPLVYIELSARNASRSAA